MQCDKCNGAGTILGVQQSSQSEYTLTCGKCAGYGTIPMFYAGIGSRDTPEPIGREMQAIAMQLAMRGWVLRSGHARPRKDAPPETVSADLEFEKGCDIIAGRKVIRGPTHQPSAMEHAQRYHPAWESCGDYAQALHARNSLIMLGDDLTVPVHFVVCWTPGGMVVGGTGQALRIAHDQSIPVFNLAVVKQASLWAWLDQGQVM